jgi:transcriptional regulator with PAS, ATPase and Fis domain
LSQATEPRPADDGSAANVDTPNPTLAQTKAEAEVLRITEVLRKNGNNRLRAAAELGISRMGLYKKLHKYRLHESP